MQERTGILSEGARRVWRYQRVLWWLFAVNLLLAAFGTLPVTSAVGRVADHSLHSQNLYRTFDVPTFLDLANNPDVALWSKFTGSTLFAVVFFAFAFFLTGGILEAYRSSGKPATGEFFQACGAFFWRWVRLLIFMLIVLTPIAILASSIIKWSGTLSDDAPQEKLGFWVDVAGMLLVLLLAMLVRLWFDMAQVRTVAENERPMRRALARAFRLTFGNLGSLFWLYFRISFLAWCVLAAGLWLWLKVPAQDVGLSFFLFEVVLLWWIGTRLWQRASETVWYERRALAPVLVMAPVPMPETVAPALEVPPPPESPPVG
ncbi:MAG: hypothetical protein LAO03_20255 [Acidobacteriia bacterium]|nr:hypothetical protein [Terriglobia bacterium]